MNSRANMEIREGNILTATEDYIVQQCCCTACRPHGLSAAIATMFPSHGNIYATQKPIKKGGNTAVLEDRPTAGTVQILGNGKDQRFIACLFAQYAMGKPGVYKTDDIPDGAPDRQKYFQQSLEALAAAIPADASLAFPYRIGCGLAGGTWSIYEKMLKDWVGRHPGLKVVLYKLD